MKLHLIDDDIELHHLLKEYFQDLQVELTGSTKPREAFEFLKNNEVDLVILDLMLPEMDGFEVCKILRAEYPILPIIMLTAKGDDLNKILGLELGADDYISKPFNPRELLARVKSIMRRIDRTEAKIKENIIYSPIWDIKLNLDSRTVNYAGEEIEFTVTEFELLKHLMENAGIVQTRDNIMDKVKGIDFEAFDRTIDIYISKLRQKLKDNPKKPQIIKTVWGVGYIFSKI